jgi:hypothetical protein
MQATVARFDAERGADHRSCGCWSAGIIIGRFGGVIDKSQTLQDLCLASGCGGVCGCRGEAFLGSATNFGVAGEAGTFSEWIEWRDVNSGAGERFEGQSQSNRGIAGNQEQAMGPKRPEATGPAGIGLPPRAAEREHEAGGAANATFECAAESATVFVGVGIKFTRVDIDRQSLFEFKQMKHVLERGADPAIVDIESAGEFEHEVGGVMFVNGRAAGTLRLVGGIREWCEEFRILPDGLPISSPEAGVGPAGE